MTNIQYFLTYHAIERFQERFSNLIEDDCKVKNWKRPQSVDNVKYFFDNLIGSSEENRSYINDTNHMIHLYEKYGYDTEYKFMENIKHAILFIIAKERNENHFRLVTVMPTKYKQKFALNNLKYNEKEKKEEKKQKRMLEKYSQYKQNIFCFENESLLPIDRLTDLEKQPNFETNYRNFLSQILNSLTQLEQQKNKKESVISFVSKNYEYLFTKKEDYINVGQMNKLSEIQSKEKSDYFTIINQLHSLISLAEIKEQFNKNVSLRSVTANYYKYTFKYYEKIDAIEIVNKEYLTEDELLEYAKKINDIHKIKEKISQNYFVVLERMNNRNLLCKTQIEDKIFTFNYCETNLAIDILKVEYVNNNNVNMSYSELTEKLLQMCANNKTEIVEQISSKKKLRKAVINNVEFRFIHFTQHKEIILLEVNMLKQLNLVDYLTEDIDFNAAYLEQYKELNNCLSKEDEFFLKKVATEENAIKVISKRKSIHKIQYKGYNYEYLLNKTKNEGYVVTLLKKEV